MLLPDKYDHHQQCESVVFASGNPALDRFNEIKKIARSETTKYFGFESNSKPLVLMIQHVLSGEKTSGYRQIETTLGALLELDVNCVINYPNSDYGSQDIISLLESKKIKGNPNIRVCKNIPRDVFVNLLRNVNLLIGNSSLAFCEGSYLRLPSINVGRRQMQRLHGGNVIFVDNNKDEIKKAINKIISDKDFCKSLKECEKIYGNGKASKIIVSSLEKIKKNREELISKNITY